MRRHFDKCKERLALEQNANNKSGRLFRLEVQGQYASDYWMIIELAADVKLRVLDRFLRNIWLECCGHLSAFEIEGTRYVSHVDKDFFFVSFDKSMDYNLSSVLEPDLEFSYEYDFGTTTNLVLKVLEDREGKIWWNKNQVQLMARNDAPLINCEKCGKTATQVCVQCIYDGQGWLCDNCAKKHKCGQDMYLPVVNSPRVGMCGYAG
jgi:hypothetical protein